MPDYYLGVDIGGTKTAFVLADKQGNVRQIHQDQSASHEIYGLELAGRIISKGISQVCSNEKISTDAIKSIYYGAAGADTEDDFRQLYALYKSLTPRTKFDFENDGLIALKSGTIDGHGMVITCGTGNTNFACNSKGCFKRIGGLSPLTGDNLGAELIAGYACSAAVRSEDGRGYPSLLGRRIPEALGLKQVEDITNEEMTPATLNTIIQALFECARLGDGKALEITWSLAQEVLDIVHEFYTSLFAEEGHFKLVLEGSVFKQRYEPLMQMLQNALHHRYDLEIIIPEWDPALGALFFAYEQSDISLTEKFSTRLINSYLQKVT